MTSKATARTGMMMIQSAGYNVFMQSLIMVATAHRKATQLTRMCSGKNIFNFLSVCYQNKRKKLRKITLQLQLKFPLFAQFYAKKIYKRIQISTNRLVIVQLTIQKCFALNHAKQM